MTKIAVISDIHANDIALDAVFEDMEKRGVDKIVCLGDLVAKYTEPSKVVDAISRNCYLVVKGNCDNIVATNEKYLFARGKLGIERLEYLNSLPKREYLLISGSLVNFFHATPNSLDKMFNPLFSNEKTKYSSNMITDYHEMFINGVNITQVSVYGHTHQRYIGVVQDKMLGLVEQIDNIIPVGQRILVNAGSVGDPVYVSDAWSNDPFLISDKISYAIIEGEINSSEISKLQIQLIEVPYKEKLKQVYTEFVAKQIKGKYPVSPNDTRRIFRSLQELGEESLVEPEIVTNGVKK